MFRHLLRLAILLPTLAAVLLLLAHLQNYNPALIERFFDHEDCAMPCWQGIRPGETSIDEALDILRDHPWIATVSLMKPSSESDMSGIMLIYWTWNRDYPFAGDLDYSEQGIIITERALVRQIYLTSSIPFGDMWLALGGADGGAVDYQYDTRRVRIDNTALYADEGVAATAMLTADCTGAYPDLWRTPVYLWLRDSTTFGLDETTYPRYLHVLRTGYQQLRGTFC